MVPGRAPAPAGAPAPEEGASMGTGGGMRAGWRAGRRAVLLAGAGAGAALAAACGAGGAGQETAGKAANPPLTMEFWHNKAQPEGQDVTTIVTRYNAQFAPTSVTEIFQGNGATLLTKLKAALAAATP